MVNFDQIISDFEKEGDIVGLWQVVARVREINPGISDGQIVQSTLACVRQLLARGFEAGDPPYSSHGYQCWAEQSPEAVITRIRCEWAQLNRLPDIADIAWFQLPSMNN